MPLALSQDVALKAVLRARDELLRAAHAVSADRHHWSPGGLAPSTVAIVAHCGADAMFHGAVLSNAPVPYPTHEERRLAEEECVTLSKAEELLNRGVTSACDAIVALPDDRMEDQIVMPWGERLTVAEGLLATASHMHYHTGQISLIQLMLGDDDYH